MTTLLNTTIEDAAVDALKKKNQKLLDLISTAIRRDKQTPKQIDYFIHRRFGFKKGHPIRDLCYLAACSIERKAKAVQS